MQVVQHAAVAQNDKCLIKAVTVRGWIIENLLPPACECLEDLCYQQFGGYRIPQGFLRGSRKCYPLLANDPTNENGGQAIGRYEVASGVAKLPGRHALPGRVRVSYH